MSKLDVKILNLGYDNYFINSLENLVSQSPKLMTMSVVSKIDFSDVLHPKQKLIVILDGESLVNGMLLLENIAPAHPQRVIVMSHIEIIKLIRPITLCSEAEFDWLDIKCNPFLLISTLFKNESLPHFTNKLERKTILNNELRILVLYLSGLPLHDISKKLNLRYKTISLYKNSALQKLGINSIGNILNKISINTLTKLLNIALSRQF